VLSSNKNYFSFISSFIVDFSKRTLPLPPNRYKKALPGSFFRPLHLPLRNIAEDVGGRKVFLSNEEKKMETMKKMKKNSLPHDGEQNTQCILFPPHDREQNTQCFLFPPHDRKQKHISNHN
jgi:hypothetical protein